MSLPLEPMNLSSPRFDSAYKFMSFLKAACSTSHTDEAVSWNGPPPFADLDHLCTLARRMDFIVKTEDPMAFVNARNNKSPTIAWLEKNDFSDWHSLFETCFGHPITFEQWTWKYRDCVFPGIGVWIEGKLIAFYGGMPRKLSYLGQYRTGIQVGDVMVHPEHRGSLSRKGPFQLAASTFLEQTLAKGAPYWIGFGFPNQRAMLVARKLHLYKAVDKLSELSWQASSSPLPWWQNLEVVHANDLAFIDALWIKMRSQFRGSILGVRDSRYIQERYMNHPTHSYRVLRLKNKLLQYDLGCFVVRVQADNRLEVLDWIALPKHFKYLISAAKAEAHRQACSSAYTWITSSHEDLFMVPGTARNELDILIPTNAWVAGNNAEDPTDHWWLTSGDTDFR